MASILPMSLVIPSMGLILAIFTLSLQMKHLLSILLTLEAIMLNLFFYLMATNMNLNLESYSCLILLTLGACEASIGLAALVSLIRTHGNDYVSSFSSQKC